MKPKIFIDGDEGTTGLQIRQRLAKRDDIEVVRISSEHRKDVSHRQRMLNDCDLAILCLPDAAAKESVSLVQSNKVRLIDASSAHRTHPDWMFGFAEFGSDYAEQLSQAARVSNPGCYSTGAIALLRPLVAQGLLPKDFPAIVHGVSGYTGGGRKMIEEFEDQSSPNFTDSPFRYYALGLEHKHVEEMRVHSLLEQRPLFTPSVARLPQGMIVQVPLQLSALPGRPKVKDIRGALEVFYAGQDVVTVASEAETGSLKTLKIEALVGSDRMKLYVFGNEAREHAVLAAVLDNLGKGASGAAVQNMNLMLGLKSQLH